MTRTTGFDDNVPSNERGAASVMVACLMVALLGFTAIAVDVGFLYAERAQLQSGADAASLAVAQSCAKNPAGPDCTTSSPLAKDIANKNALDGLANVQSVTFGTTSSGGGKVTVLTGSLEEGGEANKVSLFFANIFGMSSAEVGARANAAWGSPSAGRTAFPVAVSICQVESRIDGNLQRLQLHGTSGGNSSCPMGPAGQTVPGGFGWLAQEGGQCGAQIVLASGSGGSAPGNSGPPNCTAVYNRWISEINAGRPAVIYLPVYNVVSGTGSGAVYGLTSFAAFSVAGWKFSGGNEGDGTSTVFHNTASHVGALECTGSCRGIIGRFIKYVSLDEGYVLGPVNAYGATVVQMTD